VLEDSGEKFSLTFRWHKLNICCTGKHKWSERTRWWYDMFFLVPREITLHKLPVFARWCKLFEYYQANKFSIFHGVLRFVMVVCVDPEKYDSMSIREIWDEVRGWRKFVYGIIPGLLWAYTAEFVFIMDTILLVMFHWSSYLGVGAIFFNTFCDFDRWYYVSNAYDWADERTDFDALFEDVLWYAVLKTVLSFAMGWVHYLAVHYFHEVFRGPKDMNDISPCPLTQKEIDEHGTAISLSVPRYSASL